MNKRAAWKTAQFVGSLVAGAVAIALSCWRPVAIGIPAGVVASLAVLCHGIRQIYRSYVIEEEIRAFEEARRHQMLGLYNGPVA